MGLMHIVLPLLLLFHYSLFDAVDTTAEVPSAERENARSELARFVSDHLRIYPKRIARMEAQFDDILDLCARYSDDQVTIDPLLVVFIASRESSFKSNAKGKLGEKGYMQVHGECAKGFDLDEPYQQWHAGIKCLRGAMEECDGDIQCAITFYGTGWRNARTTAGRDKMRKRYKRFIRVRKKYRIKG